MRDKAEHRANTGDDTVHNQAVQPVRDAQTAKRIAQQHRDARHPDTIVCRVGFLCRKCLCEGGKIHILSNDFASVLILKLGCTDDIRRVSRKCRARLFNRFGIRFLRFEQRGQRGNICALTFGGLEPRIAAGHIIRICGTGLFILARAHAEQMPAITKNTVIGPVGQHRTDRRDRNIVHNKHDQRENRQRQNTVGHDAVDLVRNRHAAALLFDARLDDLRDVLIARVGDDGFRVVIQLVLDRSDDLLDLFQRVLAEVEAREHLFVALEQLDRKPATLPLLGHIRNNRLDLAECMLDRVGKLASRRRFARRCGAFCRFDQFLCALAFERGGFNHRHTQLGGKLLYVDDIAALGDNVHHVQRHDHRNPHFQQLGRQVQVSLDIGCVHQIDDRIRLFVYQIIAGDDLFERIRRKRVNARQVGDSNVLVRLIAALFFLHGNARPVADILGCAGQVVEHRGLAAVRIAGKRQTDRHVVAPFSELASANPCVKKFALLYKNFFRVRLAQRKLIAAHRDLDRVTQRRNLAHKHLSATRDAHVHDAAAGRPLALDTADGHRRPAGRAFQIIQLCFPLYTIIRDAICCEIATRVSLTDTIRFPASEETTETCAPSTKPRFCKNLLV